jgi:hypothetical protein
MHELYQLSKNLADCYVPQEYGRGKKEKLKIGIHMCSELLNKLKYDLILGTRDERDLDMHYMLDTSHKDYMDIKSLVTVCICCRAVCCVLIRLHTHTHTHRLAASELASPSLRRATSTLC